MNDAEALGRLSRLRQILVERFSDGELRTLCFDLGVDYDILPGDNKADKARELVAYLDHRGQSERIAVAGRRLRSDIDWGGGTVPTAGNEGAGSTERPATDTPTIDRREGGITVGGNLEVRGDLAGRDMVRDNVTVHAQFGEVGPNAQLVLGRQTAQTAQAAEVARLVGDLRDRLAALDIAERTKVVGQEFVDQLERELTEAEEPDASTIKVAGQWMLRNVPSLSGALARLFLNPIVGRIVNAAGDVAASWVREQFGTGA
jgi:hypothetical protein